MMGGGDWPTTSRDSRQGDKKEERSAGQKSWGLLTSLCVETWVWSTDSRCEGCSTIEKGVFDVNYIRESVSKAKCIKGKCRIFSKKKASVSKAKCIKGKC